MIVMTVSDAKPVNPTIAKELLGSGMGSTGSSQKRSGFETYKKIFTVPAESLAVVGDFFIFIIWVIQSLPKVIRRRELVFKQCEFIGVTSLPIVGIAAFFMGSVLGYQLYVSFAYFGAEALLGGSLGMALFRELAPVVGAIMVTGRAGAAIAAELASMRVSEQVDALQVMAVNPIEYLVMPRIAAGLLMMPLLSVFFAAVGSIGGMLVSCGVMGLDESVFWSQYTKYVDPLELVHCTVKGMAFGIVLTWVACFTGYRTYGGAKAVGDATRNAVVVSCLLILLVDYILTSLLPFSFAKFVL